MDDWFSIIDARCEMSVGAVQDLRDVGFVVIPGPVATDRLPQFAAAYDSAVACAAADDFSEGSSTIRVNDFVNRGPEFDGLYACQPGLAAYCRVIGQPFKLSTMHAGTVRPYSQAQNLHVRTEFDPRDFGPVGIGIMDGGIHGLMATQDFRN